MSTAAFTHSESLDKLGPALLAVQQAVEQPTKACVNPYFKSKYADLAACWAAVRGELGKNGIALLQVPCVAGNGMVLVTLLLHTSGQYLRAESPLRPKVSEKTDPDSGVVTRVLDDPQALGSCIQYMRRYSLCPLLGLTPLDDDDANAASGRSGSAEPPGQTPGGKPKRRGAPKQPTAKPPASAKQPPSEPLDPPITREGVGKMLLEMTGDDRAAAAELLGFHTGATSLRDLTDERLPGVYRTIKAAYVGWQRSQEP